MLDAPPHQRLIIALVALAFMIIPGLFSVLWFQYRVHREIKDAINRDHDKTGSAILGVTLREWFFEKLRPFEEFFLRHRLTPNQLTVVGFSLGMISSVLYFGGQIGAAGWFLLAAGAFDIMDGTVARKTQRCTASGAYFDSVLDRYAEMIVSASLLGYFLRTQQIFMVWMVMFMIIGAFMVSYTRAKAESAGVVAKVGIMQRPERFVFLGLGSVFSSILNGLTAPWLPQRHYLLMVVIIFIGFMSNWTALRRFRFAFATLREGRES